MKPPFAYFGGKSRLAGMIADLMPPHRVYLEPFAGSLAVLFAKTPTPVEIVNDADDALVTFFRVLRDQPEDLERACRLTPYSRSEFDAADDFDCDDDLEVARRFWVRIRQSFAHTARAKSGWSISTARSQSPSNATAAMVNRFAACAERLHGVMVENRDAVDVIQRCGTIDSVIYADPPYIASTRRGGENGKSRDYRCDMGGVQDHERLAAALHDTPATVLLSGYRSDLYDALYAGWDRLDIDVRVGTTNLKKVSDVRAVESVWSNRPIAAQGRLDIEHVEVA